MSEAYVPYGRQSISDADIEAVVAVLRGDWLTQGPAVPAFERALTDRFGARHAVAVNSATSALHLACLALGVGPGAVVWTVPNTFVASANCARYCGADVDFVDIDAATWCMSVNALAEKLAAARQTGDRLPAVVIPVHLAGQPCDMAAIAALGREYGFRIIEDASHAVGATYRGAAIGACTHSDIAVFSFHPVKIITTGEGGAAFTNDDGLAARMRLLRTHGITRDVDEMTRAPDGPWYYEQLELGFNYRMTDLQAALGTSQLQRLELFLGRRRAIAAHYDDAFAELPVQRQQRLPDAESAHHLYVVRVPADLHRALFDRLRAANIGVNLHYMPVHLQPYYRALGFTSGRFPAAEAYAAEAISLPMYADLDADSQARAIDGIRAGLTAIAKA